jgi:uncharacterized protein (DUF697 family)
LPRLIRRAFRHYYEEVDRAALERAYASRDRNVVAARLIRASAKDAALLGGIVGAIVSADEVVAILSAGEGGLGIPANLAIACLGIAGEAVLLARVQLQLVASLSRLYEIPGRPEAVEEISAILASALGTSLAETGRRARNRVRTRLTMRVPGYVGKEALGGVPRLGRRVGIKLFERNVVKYGAPVVSLLIGSSWNYLTTRTVGRAAQRHLQAIAVAREMDSGPFVLGG